MEQARMTTLADIDRLASSIAALVTAQSMSSDFWDMDDIAYHLRASKSTVTRWASLPDFPRPIRPPTAGRGLGHPLPVPPNAKVSGAGTASAGLPGWQANGETE
jgi:hypothetical protein